MKSQFVFPRRRIFLCCLIVLAKFDQFCALGPHRCVLFHTIAVRHHNNRRQPEPFRCQRHRLPVISSCRRNQPARPWSALHQLLDIHDGCSRLERPGWRLVFVLYPNLTPQSFAQQRPAVLRRGRHHAVHQLCSLLNLGDRRQCRCHLVLSVTPHRSHHRYLLIRSSRISDSDAYFAHSMLALPSAQGICHQSRAQRDRPGSDGSSWRVSSADARCQRVRPVS